MLNMAAVYDTAIRVGAAAAIRYAIVAADVEQMLPGFGALDASDARAARVLASGGSMALVAEGQRVIFGHDSLLLNGRIYDFGDEVVWNGLASWLYEVAGVERILLDTLGPLLLNTGGGIPLVYAAVFAATLEIATVLRQYIASRLKSMPNGKYVSMLLYPVNSLVAAATAAPANLTMAF